MARIPKILHYCFGMAPDFGGKPWSLIHHVCVASAIAQIRPDEVRFYYHYEPTSPWWELTRPLVTPVWIELPTQVFGNPVLHPAHRADVVRLERILADGGIYLDADVLVKRSFDSLLDESTVLGIENVHGTGGLANAVILAEPGAPFIRRWFEEYRWFRGSEHAWWGEHSVELPARMAAQHPDEITVLPFTDFFWPLWTPEHVDWVFASDDPVGNDDAFAHHLWESKAWPYVRDLTPGEVRRRDTVFHRWARPYVAELPDDYGWQGPGAPPRNEAIASALEVPPESDSRKELFTRAWRDAGGGEFFSGVGSRGPAADLYVERIAAELAALYETLGRDVTVVDIGCGDFAIGRQIVEACPFIRYVGCDIVPEMVEQLQQRFGSERIEFRTLDIVTETPPEGDVALVRQVFQHLPNRDVRAALGNLRGFAALYLSEGNPVVRHGPVNPDKPLDLGVRFDWRRGIGRGLEWAEPPFSLRTQEILRAFVPSYEEVVTERVWLD